MALDEADHRLFVGVHVPPRLVVFDTTSGRTVAVLKSVQDMDDLYFDADRKRIYMPGGEGFIDAFQMTDPGHYHLLARISTALGARTAGYFDEESERLRPSVSCGTRSRRAKRRGQNLHGARLNAANRRASRRVYLRVSRVWR